VPPALGSLHPQSFPFCRGQPANAPPTTPLYSLLRRTPSPPSPPPPPSIAALASPPQHLLLVVGVAVVDLADLSLPFFSGLFGSEHPLPSLSLCARVCIYKLCWCRLHKWRTPLDPVGGAATVIYLSSSGFFPIFSDVVVAMIILFFSFLFGMRKITSLAAAHSCRCPIR
jgi:hypothetical protein